MGLPSVMVRPRCPRNYNCDSLSQGSVFQCWFHSQRLSSHCSKDSHLWLQAYILSSAPPREEATIFPTAPLRTQRMSLTYPFLNQYLWLEPCDALIGRVWVICPRVNFRGMGFSRWGSLPLYHSNGKGVAPYWKIKVLLPKGRMNAGQANTADVHCSMELERTSVLLCPRNSTTK